MCCHTETEAANQTFYLTQSQYTDAGPTSSSTDPLTPGAWQGSHWSTPAHQVTGMTRSAKRSTSKRSTSKRSTSKRSTSKRSTSKRSTSKRSTSKRSTSKRSTSKRSKKDPLQKDPKRSTSKRSKKIHFKKIQKDPLQKDPKRSTSKRSKKIHFKKIHFESGNQTQACRSGDGRLDHWAQGGGTEGSMVTLGPQRTENIVLLHSHTHTGILELVSYRPGQ